MQPCILTRFVFTLALILRPFERSRIAVVAVPVGSKGGLEPILPTRSLQNPVSFAGT